MRHVQISRFCVAAVLIGCLCMHATVKRYQAASSALHEDLQHSYFGFALFNCCEGRQMSGSYFCLGYFAVVSEMTQVMTLLSRAYHR